jgi:hypothetical protein
VKKLVEEWTYPMTLNYRKGWSDWEAVREIVQNMMDASESNFSITKTPNGLLLKDKGTGLKKKHLLLGVSEKSEGARGKFGEGLKLALIVLKRLGYGIKIKSSNLKISVETTSIENEKCLKLILDETPNNIIGTEVLIEGYTGSTFTDNFVNGNKTVVYTCSKGQIISEYPQKLYAKDIYVCDLKDAKYSYNLKNIELAEDRNIPAEWTLHREIGKVYETIKPKDRNILVNFFQAVKAEKYESKVDLYRFCIDDEKSWIYAFKKVYGDKAVLQTSDTWTREATWRGAEVVSLPQEISNALEAFLQTDKKFTIKDNSKSHVRVFDKRLTDDEWHNIDILRRLGRKINPKIKITAYILDDPAIYDRKKNKMMINRTELQNLEKCLGHLTHELAHGNGASDMTAEMIREIGVVAGQLLYPFVKKTMRRNKRRI